MCVRKESLDGQVETSNIFVASLPKANSVNIYLLWESWYVNKYVFSRILVKTWEVSYKGKLYEILLIRGGLAFQMSQKKQPGISVYYTLKAFFLPPSSWLAES